MVTAHYLLMLTFVKHANMYADTAIEYLCCFPEALEIGYLDADYGVARQLIAAVTPFATSDMLGSLERLLLPYRGSDQSEYGYAQWLLLTSIDITKRSATVKRKITRWQHKFNFKLPPFPEPRVWHPGDSLVRSPIPNKDIAEFTDQQWYDAIARYATDGIQLAEDHHLVGGVHELARAFEGATRMDPSRFARLAASLPDQAHPAYFDAALRGISKSSVAIEDAIALFLRCHQLPEHPCGRELCWSIGSFAQNELPPTVLSIANWYAMEDPDPDKDTWRIESLPGGQPYYGGSIDTAGMNSTRGAAALVIGDLLAADVSYSPHFLPTIELLIHDPIVSVRACAIKALMALAMIDREQAAVWLAETCQSDEQLLSSDYVHRLLRPLLITHFELLLPVLERMISSSGEAISTTGASIATLVALAIPEAQYLVATCLVGSAAQRLGVARIYAANIKLYGRQYQSQLVELFSDLDPQVRSEAASCFHDLSGNDLLEIEEIVSGFIASEGLNSDPTHLVYALGNTTAKLPDVVCMLCERLLATVEITNDYQARDQYAMQADSLIALLLRVYSQTMDPSVQNRCLNVLDRIAIQGFPRIDRALIDYER